MWSITPVTITATRWPFPATKRLFAAMRLFRQLILIAVIAGVGVGVVTALLHEMTTAPLVIAAGASAADAPVALPPAAPPLVAAPQCNLEQDVGLLAGRV